MNSIYIYGIIILFINWAYFLDNRYVWLVYLIIERTRIFKSSVRWNKFTFLVLNIATWVLIFFIALDPEVENSLSKSLIKVFPRIHIFSFKILILFIGHINLSLYCPIPNNLVLLFSVTPEVASNDLIISKHLESQEAYLGYQTFQWLNIKALETL